MTSNSINIPEAPKLNGLTFRIFEGTKDYTGMVNVWEKSKGHDQIDPFSTLESIPTVNDIANSISENHCDPTTDILLELQKRSVQSVKLHMNGENIAGARSLYEKVGFKHLKAYIRYRKPF